MKWQNCKLEEAPEAAIETLKGVGAARVRSAESRMMAELGLVCLALIKRVEQLESEAHETN